MVPLYNQIRTAYPSVQKTNVSMGLKQKCNTHKIWGIWNHNKKGFSYWNIPIVGKWTFLLFSVSCGVKGSFQAQQHLRAVRLLVPRFHIAHWTALHFGIFFEGDIFIMLSCSCLHHIWFQCVDVCGFCFDFLVTYWCFDVLTFC